MVLAISCAVTIIVNLTSDPWNAKDDKILTRAKYVCATDYRHAPEFPCVKSISKEPEQHYSVLCGMEKLNE